MPDLADIVSPDGGTIDTGSAIAVGVAAVLGLSMALSKIKSLVEDGSKVLAMARNGSFWVWQHMTFGGIKHREQAAQVAAMRADLDDALDRLSALEVSHAEVCCAIAPPPDAGADSTDAGAKRREVLRLIADILGAQPGDLDG